MTDPGIPDIGKYRILELVGEGAMGVVYKAVDSVLDRTVAIKVMNDAIARHEELRQRFLREAQAAASLQHPNVVSIYDLGEVDGHLFIAMEFVQGADLETLMKSGQPLTLPEKLDIVIDVLTGLSFTHKRGIVHRDIKPANIRVTEDGRAKLMDFGVAHLTSSNLTSTGASLGTPVYMSPEQITGGKATPSTDVFAVGAVLYELLAGVKPFDAPTLQALFFKILTDKPRPVRELVPDIPSALEHVVEKAMAKEPPQRYQSALDMANDLTGVRAAIAGSSSYPTSVSLSATVEHAIRQSRQAAHVRTRNREITIAGALLAAAVVVAVSTMLTRRADRAERAAADTARVASASARAALSPPATADPPASADSTRVTPAATVATSSGERDDPPPAAPARASAPAVPSTRDSRRSEPAPTAARARPDAGERPPRDPAPTQPAAPQAVAAAPQTASSSAPSVARPVPSSEPTLQQGSTASRPFTSSALVAPLQSAPAAAPPPAPAPATAADVAPVFEAYARAIESRDVAAIRRVYPGLTQEQQRGFEQFFEAAKRIDVTFHVAGVEGTATTAEARVTGTYQYESSSGRAERQPVSFSATLRREGAAWRLVSLR